MSKKKYRSLKIALFFFIFIFAAGLVLSAYAYFLNRPSTYISEESNVFKVTQGESLAAIADRLERGKLIRSALLIKLLSKVSRTDGSIKSGYFRILPGDSTIDIHNVLVAGYQEQVKVTLPEGWTSNKVAGHLESKEIIGIEELMNPSVTASLLQSYGIPAESLEGYLFPDTYFFPKGYPAYGILERMVDNFFQHLETIVPDYRDWDKQLLHERIVLASIVEREYRRSEEAPLIASVFYNRLKNNVGLESCATLVYIITEVQGRPQPEFLTSEDIKIDSAYNTYLWAGLPPGPISNPGTVALKAAFYPAETDYWYFLLKNPATGEHYFSTDLEEHNWAKYYYLKSVGTGG
ncbi:MAG TPA: endolytic transglycosylase MltG [bacterium]|nr:endolytic transglycosylase MltG [bacterium]